MEAQKIGPHNQHLLQSGQATAIHFDGEVDKLMVIPRPHLMQFVRHIIDRYKVLFCTTGIQQYAEAVLQAIGDYLLRDTSVTSEEAKWIKRCFEKR